MVRTKEGAWKEQGRSSARAGQKLELGSKSRVGKEQEQGRSRTEVRQEHGRSRVEALFSAH